MQMEKRHVIFEKERYYGPTVLTALPFSPTTAQIKAETWMAIIHGSQGLIYFCHQFQPRFAAWFFLDVLRNSSNTPTRVAL